MTATNRQVQLLELDILKVFMDVCERHGLRYFMTGGSLIGILRHGGFIPWDDDIDIGMPRPDYERFLQISHQVLPPGYRIANNSTDPSWYFAMSQLVDAETEVDIYMTEVPRRSHLWIDLFPLDGLPDNALMRYLHIKRILMYRYLIQVANIRTQVDTHKTGRPVHEKLLLGLLKHLPLGRVIDSRRLLRRLDATLKRYDYDRQAHAGNMLGKYREREAVPKVYFGTPCKLKFEDVMVDAPQMYHELQTALYGNYMKLPPEHARVSHDIQIVRMRAPDRAAGACS